MMDDSWPNTRRETNTLYNTRVECGHHEQAGDGAKENKSKQRHSQTIANYNIVANERRDMKLDVTHDCIRSKRYYTGSRSVGLRLDSILSICRG